MAVVNPKPMLLAFMGTSLTSMGLAPPWNQYLREHMMGSAYCRGAIEIFSLAQGGGTSTQMLARTDYMNRIKPDVVLFEDCGINDCVPSFGVSLEQATTNFNDFVDSAVANNPNIILCHQTMSSASAIDTNRATLEDYYNNGKVNAAARGIQTLDNYASWPKPLLPEMTIDGDGLHPTWEAFKQYSWPNIIAWADTLMQEYWG